MLKLTLKDLMPFISTTNSFIKLNMVGHEDSNVELDSLTMYDSNVLEQRGNYEVEAIKGLGCEHLIVYLKVPEKTERLENLERELEEAGW